ncbi:hypothetical protein LSM04_002107 [Trypanosoma melophagium]|uniref:uncharacterized protein n=1 Tax=Trypanosoma melophagium TaxID=715481 RepID=UPI00351A601D|nr:hypothetical protein LSM04_002107 [Trypanosoma melophagium]
MFAPRRALFGLAGGFMITDFYVNCVNVMDIRLDPIPTLRIENIREGKSNSNNSIMDVIRRRMGRASIVYEEMPATSLREDIERFMQKNTLVAALLVCTLVSFGGIWSLIGSASAVAFDGESGADRYEAVKEWLKS